MATILIDSDVVLVIYNTNSTRPIIGVLSDFSSSPHPGTNRTLHGWEWSRSPWAHEGEVDEARTPVLLDASEEGIPRDYFVSGIGGGDDLEVLQIEAIPVSGERRWAPRIQHGGYFFRNEGSYLFSDQSVRLMADPSEQWSGLTSIPLPGFPKTGIPVQARIWEWDRDEYRWKAFIDFRKRVDFTGILEGATRSGTRDNVTEEILYQNRDTTKREFLLERQENGSLLAIFNNNYAERVGVEITTSGQLSLLDQLGTADTRDNQVFYTTYSPTWSGLDTIHVYTYPTLSGAWQEWSTVGEITGANQVAIDSDLGLVRFGTAAQGARPSEGDLIGATYFRTPEIEYEPDLTPDYVLALEESADVNPLRKVNERGFIVLKDRPTAAGSIVLSARLPAAGNDVYGPAEVGVGYVVLEATVRAEGTGELLEGIGVTFNLLEGEGTFSGGSDTVTSVTNKLGIARAFWIPPLTVDDIGRFADTVKTTVDAELTLSGMTVRDNLDQVFVYKVFTDDPTQGIPLAPSEEISFYQDFFTESGIFGRTGSSDPAIAALEPDQLWEKRHRILEGLLTPTEYNRELRNGRKQIVTALDANAVNPATGASGAFVPIQPTSSTISGEDTVLTFSGIALDPVGGDLDGYYVIVPLTTQFQASASQDLTGQTILSNIIKINVELSDAAKGLYIIEALNEVPADLVSWVVTAAHEGRKLPLGWRLRSAGITIASALNGATFIPLPGQ